MQIDRIAVLGSGTMGNGIAQVLSMSGFQVKVMDIKEEFLKNAEKKIAGSLKRMVEKGKIDRSEADGIQSRLSWTTKLSDAVEGASVIIEAVPEQMEIKKATFGELGKLTGSHAIIASNTSSFSISALASFTTNPERVIGMHWFNPPVMMKLVEIIKGVATAQETIRIIRDLAAACGKETVVCADSQGFIVTRALVALRLECYRIYSEGVAIKEDIDKALRLGLGHPMGQFELADMSGLDIEPPICEGLEKAFGERFKAPQNILNVVRAGWHGRKTGKGWYNYTDEKN
jgi:3-hydroxybutyryl-CoA dehydrogenase